MSPFLRNSILICFIFLAQSLLGQFEKLSIRNTSIEYETDLIADTANTYVKLMLCGDLIHRKHLMNKYAPLQDGVYSYRSWFRQVKPLFFYPDFVVGSLRSFFPNRANMTAFPNSAPDEYLVELEYTGFNVMMMGNSSVLTDRKHLNDFTCKKLDATDIFKAGFYKDTTDKKLTFPLVLEKKGVRIAFLNYTLDSVLLDLPQENINFFEIDSVRKDVEKSRKKMLADYVVAYIDWAKQDSLKLGKVAELLNMGIDVIIGTGNGEAFTNADLMTYSDGSLKLHVDNIGYFNAESADREKNKSAVIEIVLKKNKATRQVTTHDMGFIPIWTLIDHERYAVLPISNMEEKHIQNVGLNLVQYSTMKTALTDLRFAFFDKIPELHYDYTDKMVSNVEQTAFIRKTLMKEQDKINENIKQTSIDEYYNLFGSEPPSTGSFRIPYEDIFGMYAKNTYTNVVQELKLDKNPIEKEAIERELKKQIQDKQKLEATDLRAFEEKSNSCGKLDSILQEEFKYQNNSGKGFETSHIDSIYEAILNDYQNDKIDTAGLKLDLLRNASSIYEYQSDLFLNHMTAKLGHDPSDMQKRMVDSLLRIFIKSLAHFQYKDPVLKESAYNELFSLLSENKWEDLDKKIIDQRRKSIESISENHEKQRRIELAKYSKLCHDSRIKINEIQNKIKQSNTVIDSLEAILEFKVSYQRRIQHNINVKKNIEKATKSSSSYSRNRDSFELYGNNQDEISNRGIINIKANSEKYTRDHVRIYTAREKFVMDSIRKYNERFIIVDSIAELKKILKQKKLEEKRRKDSIVKASFNPNYKSTYNPDIDPSSLINPHVPEIKSGVFTNIDISKEDKSPVRNIEEYFIVQVFALSKQKEIDLDQYPYLTGYEVKLEDGFYKYYIGRTNSVKLAFEMYKNIKAKGHPDAVLVKFTNGVKTVVSSK